MKKLLCRVSFYQLLQAAQRKVLRDLPHFSKTNRDHGYRETLMYGVPWGGDSVTKTQLWNWPVSIIYTAIWKKSINTSFNRTKNFEKFALKYRDTKFKHRYLPKTEHSKLQTTLLFLNTGMVLYVLLANTKAQRQRAFTSNYLTVIKMSANIYSGVKCKSSVVFDSGNITTEAAFAKRFLKSIRADLAKEKGQVFTIHTGSQNHRRINLKNTCSFEIMGYC